jgi:hypothetical protein
VQRGINRWPCESGYLQARQENQYAPHTRIVRIDWRIRRVSIAEYFALVASEEPSIAKSSVASLGTSAEFDRTFLPHLDAAYNLAPVRMRNADDAEDVVQEAYLGALRGFSSFRGEASRPWLLAIDPERVVGAGREFWKCLPGPEYFPPSTGIESVELGSNIQFCS